VLVENDTTFRRCSFATPTAVAGVIGIRHTTTTLPWKIVNANSVDPQFPRLLAEGIHMDNNLR
jgi:hypothetical protein